jgi:hypothetical protein
MLMAEHRIFTMAFSKVYPMYVQKAQRKNRSKDEVDQIIRWLTGYDEAGLERHIGQHSDVAAFCAQAPAIHPNASLIKGVVCGVRVEDVQDPLMQKMRYLDTKARRWTRSCGDALGLRGAVPMSRGATGLAARGAPHAGLFQCSRCDCGTGVER